MTKSLPTHRDRHFDEGLPNEQLPDRDGLLFDVRDAALRLITEAPLPPQVVRVSAGAVQVEMEWREGASSRVSVDNAPTESAPADVVVPDTPPAEEPGTYVTAPIVGVFYRAPEPGAAPFVREGDVVSAGAQVGIVEAMKLMIPVEADDAGVVAEVFTGNGESVEYGERLFRLASPDQD